MVPRGEILRPTGHVWGERRAFKEYIERFNGGDVEGALRYAHPEIRFRAPARGTPGGDRNRRSPGIGSWTPSISWTAGRSTATISVIWAIGCWRSVLSEPSGKDSRVEWKCATVLARFKDGLVTDFTDHGSREKALEAAGLSNSAWTGSANGRLPLSFPSPERSEREGRVRSRASPSSRAAADGYSAGASRSRGSVSRALGRPARLTVDVAADRSSSMRIASGAAPACAAQRAEHAGVIGREQSVDLCPAHDRRGDKADLPARLANVIDDVIEVGERAAGVVLDAAARRLLRAAAPEAGCEDPLEGLLVAGLPPGTFELRSPTRTIGILAFAGPSTRLVGLDRANGAVSDHGLRGGIGTGVQHPCSAPVVERLQVCVDEAESLAAPDTGLDRLPAARSRIWTPPSSSNAAWCR